MIMAEVQDFQHEHSSMSRLSRSIRSMGQVSLLYFHEHANVTRYGIRALQDSPQRDRLLASGSVQLIRANIVNTSYLKVGTLTYPILPKLKCWCLDSFIIFPVPSGGYWKLTLVSEDDKALNNLVSLLKTMVDFQEDNTFFAGCKDVSPRLSVAATFDQGEPEIMMSTKSQSRTVTDMRLLFAEPKTVAQPRSPTELSKPLSRVGLARSSSQSPEKRTLTTDTTKLSKNSKHMISLPVPEVATAVIIDTRESDRAGARRMSDPDCERGSRYEQASVHVHTEQSTLEAKMQEHIISNDEDAAELDVVYESAPAYQSIDTHAESTGMPTSLVKLFMKNATTVESSSTNSLTEFPQIVLLPVLLESDITSEEWNIVVDEIDAKHQSIARRLEAVPRLQHGASVTMHDVAPSPGLIRWTGQLIYLAAHGLSTNLRRLTSTSDHRGCFQDCDYLDLDADLDGHIQSELNHFCTSIIQSIETIGRCGKDIKSGVLKH